MLTPEDADKKLASIANMDWFKQLALRALKFPKNVRAVGFSLAGRSAKGIVLSWQTQHLAHAKAQRQLARFTPHERQQLFKLLFPKFAPYIEAGWQIVSTLPYQISGNRRSFRLKEADEVILKRRYRWLSSLVQTTSAYNKDIIWFAAWTAHLGGWGTNALGILFASAINIDDAIGREVFDILIASAEGEHEIGAMGRHIPRALLVANRPDGWDFIERLLLAAQRQEGLRQTILETVDEAHPQAFQRMIRLILDHNLVRFSATVRAIDVWFGFGWESVQGRVVHTLLEQALQFLTDNDARQSGLQSHDPQTIYLALWATAFHDAKNAIAPAEYILKSTSQEHRFIATHFLAQLQIPPAYISLLRILKDDDLVIATTALNGLNGLDLADTDLFEILEVRIEAFPKQAKIYKGLVWPWISIVSDRQKAAKILIGNLGTRSPNRLSSYLPLMNADNRYSAVRQLADTKKSDADTRAMMLKLVGDASRYVREAALKALGETNQTISETEAQALERLLTRKATDLRRGVITLLLGQSDDLVLKSAERLLAAKKSPERLAGLELLHQLIETKRSPEVCRAICQHYQASQKKINKQELTLLETILVEQTKTVTLEDALGLMDVSARTRPQLPKAKEPRFHNQSLKKIAPDVVDVIFSLDALIQKHQDEPIIIETWQGKEEVLLANAHHGFPMPDADQSREENLARLPLRDIWESWWAQQPATLRESQCILLYAQASLAGRYFNHYIPDPLPSKWVQKIRKKIFAPIKRDKLQYEPIIECMLHWLIWLTPVQDTPDILLDAVTYTFSLIPQAELKRERDPNDYNDKDWRLNLDLLGWLNVTHTHRSKFPDYWQDKHHTRFWHLMRWFDEPHSNATRNRPSLNDLLKAYGAGSATEADLLDQLLGARPATPKWSYYGQGFQDLRHLSKRKSPPEIAQYPILADLVQRCRQRIIELELRRGDMPTAASEPAMDLSSVEGVDTVISLLQTFGKENFIRGWTYDSLSRSAVFSHLIRVSFPKLGEAPELFAEKATATNIPQSRLVELAIYAPQWTPYVECALQWPGFTEAIWWIHAHTKDQRWQVDNDIRDLWQAQSSERTPLSAQDLLDGAVDVAWFEQFYVTLGPDRWAKLLKASKYASGGGGHKRAQLFADALLGQVDQGSLVARIENKRHQDSVRALGLLPLSKTKKESSELLARYEIIQAFQRGSRKFGAQRQASEKLAARISLENLARTAGFPDPVRLEWAMEAQSLADLADGYIETTVDDVTLRLSINQQGNPDLTVEKKGKLLKAVPARLRKEADVVAIRERKTTITRQVSRMRTSLEAAMCRGDFFFGHELQSLSTHPVLKPLLEDLIFIGDQGLGYPIDQGQTLLAFDGQTTPISAETRLRIAHPYDLWQTSDWPSWQRSCFQQERIQPFKQVFRELYVFTDTEMTQGFLSRRYEGQQVNPRQALTLLGKRGWVNYPEEGIRRTFHQAGLSAWLTFMGYNFTPTDVEGLTIEYIGFAKQGDWKPLNPADINPRLFSEVMRDLDLVVSVAHVGGVNPEATASTVEMRTALLLETCQLLQIDNVQVKRSHAIIEGQLGNYSIHLGSSIVHRQPGGALCIVPVHAQHRGRLFLPFADDDPKTAEVIAKVLLLARDDQIKDPTILEQILA